ncbi:MAG: 30S ribosomal protein S3ae [Thaumarchaeota archaeon]|nr:30S ribosomal protein S3ae [Nitrososphaerota archaeon]MDE0266884.1 30S ribosomal protein S3ae [Nitrososphaerota archaeon]MDE0526219.1 30S ribosomal protein S3ae [Nitrososphaerota archaeon]
MARRKGRVKDKWREKRWVTVHAPQSFNSVQIGYIPITDDETAIGRVMEVTLHDILKGDASQYQYKMYFQISKVDGDKAHTIFKRFEYSKEFLRSLVRRGSSKINLTTDIKTSDGYIFRIKIIALTHRQLNTSRQHALRLIAQDIINKTVPEMTIEQFVQATCYSKINSDIMAAFKKVIRVRHVGLEKVKLIRTAEKETVLLEA